MAGASEVIGVVVGLVVVALALLQRRVRRLEVRVERGEVDEARWRRWVRAALGLLWR